MKDVVFDRETGAIGIKRLANKNEESTHGTNYVVDELDPIFYSKIRTVAAHADPLHKWEPLSHNDPRYQFINLFSIIEEGDAEWNINVRGVEDLGAAMDEMNISNPHRVFELIRGLFEVKPIIGVSARLGADTNYYIVEQVKFLIAKGDFDEHVIKRAAELGFRPAPS